MALTLPFLQPCTALRSSLRAPRGRRPALCCSTRQGSRQLVEPPARGNLRGAVVLKSAAGGELGSGIDWRATGACFAFPAIGGMLFGYDIGASGGAIVSLTAHSSSDWGYGLSPLLLGFVVSASLMGALAGSVGVLLGGDRMGRREELLGAAGLYGLGAALMASACSLPHLLLGRTVYGLGIGLAMHSAPAYIAETSPPAVRGLLMSCKEAAIVGGILLGYLVTHWLGATEEGWRGMYGAAFPLAGILAAGMARLPESPRWLLLAGRGEQQAADALRRTLGSQAEGLLGEERVRSQLQEMADSLATSGAASREQGAQGQEAVPGALAGVQGSASGGRRGSRAAVSRTLFLEPRFRRPLLVGTSLMLFQQITGQPSVLYYATKLFSDAGFSLEDAGNASILVGVVKLGMTLVAVSLVDSLGRRPLLLGGASGMVVGLTLLGATAPGSPFHGSSASAAVGVCALLLFVGCYQVSFGPISWLLVGELFPLEVRSQAIAVATITNFSSNFLVSLVLPGIEETCGMSGAYFSFAALAALAVASVYLTVPETKGRSLEEVEAMWR